MSTPAGDECRRVPNAPAPVPDQRATIRSVVVNVSIDPKRRRL
jgi:hypothetical protein